MQLLHSQENHGNSEGKNTLCLLRASICLWSLEVWSSESELQLQKLSLFCHLKKYLGMDETE